MALHQKIKDDMREMMKAQNAAALTVLRGALSVIAAKEKDKRLASGQADAVLSEDEIISVISSEVKKRRDAIALYEQGGRPELAENEKQEIAILQKYLPEQLSAEELRKLVEASIKKVGAASIKDMGKVMADLQPAIKGKADNAEVSKIVKEFIS